MNIKELKKVSLKSFAEEHGLSQAGKHLNKSPKTIKSRLVSAHIDRWFVVEIDDVGKRCILVDE